jgi:ABC-type glycerol-3-phosphate transport system substrate-binding protein
MKKILALILAAVMMLSLCSIAAAEEPVKLVWFVYTDSEAPLDWAEVEEVLNAYSAEKIGVTCEFKYMNESQVAIATQTGEISISPSPATGGTTTPPTWPLACS